METYLIGWLIAALAFGTLGSFVARAKARSAGEGLLLGLLFGPFGCLIEALLPNGSEAPGRRDPVDKPSFSRLTPGIDDPFLVAEIERRYRATIEMYEDWGRLSYHRRLDVLKHADAAIGKELKLSPTRLSDLAAEARRAILA